MADPQKKNRKFRIKWWWDSEDEQAAKKDPQYAEALEKADDMIKEKDLDKREVEKKKDDIVKEAIKETKKENEEDSKKTAASAQDGKASSSTQVENKDKKDGKGLFHNWFGDDEEGQHDKRDKKENMAQRDTSNKYSANGEENVKSRQPADQKKIDRKDDAKDTLAKENQQGHGKDKDESRYKGWFGNKQPTNEKTDQKELSREQKSAEQPKKTDQNKSTADKNKGFWNWGRNQDENGESERNKASNKPERNGQGDGTKQETKKVSEQKSRAVQDVNAGKDKSDRQKISDDRPGKSKLDGNRDAGKNKEAGKEKPDKNEKKNDANEKDGERDKSERTNTLLVICGCINVVLAILFFLYTEVWADATVTHNMLLVGVLLLVILIPFILLPFYKNLICRILAVLSVIITIILLVYLFINRARVFYYQLLVREADRPQFENIERMYWSERNPVLFNVLKDEGYYIEEWAESSKKKGAKIFILKGKLTGTDKEWQYDRDLAEQTLRDNIEKGTDETGPAVAYSLIRVSWTTDRAEEILKEIKKTKFSKLGENYVFVIGVFDVGTRFGSILGSEPVSIDAASEDQPSAGGKLSREFNSKV
ncbi:uncharacterized protein VICG_00236 [Vittaforma corneae ATCC 50505]|uniref:Uncharacterized protein n=1 Tax=Vittaforma corneae (strain ATCC 50505) TaxID=993615 RepID=L2GQ05_VITCO|nr:uncharacterized protein VICG_00236 [Vittaforma corneae ATCC 50505]ELA42921.1 hypothetical protein VICG_00236 [Vittaforma corneae ATCC 50505]